MAVPSPSLKAALLVSLVAHVLLLAWGRWSLAPTPSAAGGGMRVDWRAGSAVPGSDGGPRPAARSPDPVAANPPPLPARKPTPVLAARGPAQVPAATPGLPLDAAEAVSERRGEMAVRSGAGPAEAAERSAPAPVREGAGGDALRQYRLALALEARRFKRYPRLARERGWEGTVEVTVVLGGLAPIVSLQRSSGHGLLDDQGLEMIGRALAATPLPEALRGKELRLLLPIQFSLEE